MKRLLAVLTAAVLLVALAACANNPNPSPTVGAQTVSPSPAISPSPSPTEKPTEQPSVDPLPSPSPSEEIYWDEDALSQVMKFPALDEIGIEEYYQLAAEVYGWTQFSTMPTNPYNHFGEQCEEVKIPGVHNAADMRAFFGKYFSPKISEELCPKTVSGDYPAWIEQDGKFYFLQAPRGSNEKIGDIVDYDLKDVSATEKTLTIKYEVYGSDLSTVEKTESQKYTLELIDDRWVFSEFELIW